MVKVCHFCLTFDDSNNNYLPSQLIFLSALIRTCFTFQTSRMAYLPLSHEPNNKVSQEELLDNLCKERKNDYILLIREKFSSISKTIEVKAMRMFLERYTEDRPYGLPPHWSESGREQIWTNILNFVDEPKSVIYLCETCVLFQCLLEDKYRGARLAEVVKVCINKRNGMLPLKTLLDLRLVSRTAKNFIDSRIMVGRLDDDGCVEYLIPGISLRLAASQLEQPRLGRIMPSLESKNVPPGTFPLREVILYENRGLNLPGLRSSIRRLFELVGDSIHSLGYFSEQSSHDTYNILRGWVSLLPNLEEMLVNIPDSFNDAVRLIKPFEPFPSLPKLERFWEGNEGGLSSGHLGEILRANRNLKLVKLCRIPENRLDTMMAEGILDHHQIQKFIFHGNSGLTSFRDRPINWPLTTLDLYMRGPNASVIPAGAFFRFVNQFGATLKQLKALVKLMYTNSRDVRDMTMMNLPNLVQLQWFLQTDSQPLSFMIPLKKLERFDIVLPEQSVLVTEEMLKHLERFLVPRLFPAMRRIRAGNRPLQLQNIWESGKAIF